MSQELKDYVESLATLASPDGAADAVMIYDDDTDTVKILTINSLIAVAGLVKTLLSAKGHLISASAANTPAGLAVGTDGQMLYADSAEATGLKWAAPPSGSGITAAIMDAKGDLIGASAADTPVRVAVGVNGSVLTAASGESAGIKWEEPGGGTSSDADTATPTPVAINRQYNLTALAQAATFAAPSGTPVDGHRLVVRVKDNGTARALSWNAIYRAIGITLPTTTVISKTTYVGFIYNAADSKWDGVATVTQA